MAMIVDEARADGAAVGVDGLLGSTRQLADFGDLSVLDPNVAAECRHAGPIHDQPVLYQQVVRHRLSLPRRSAPPRFCSSRRKCSTGPGPAYPCIVYGRNSGKDQNRRLAGAREVLGHAANEPRARAVKLPMKPAAGSFTGQTLTSLHLRPIAGRVQSQ